MDWRDHPLYEIIEPVVDAVVYGINCSLAATFIIVVCTGIFKLFGWWVLPTLFLLFTIIEIIDNSDI